MATSTRQNELVALQSEISSEIGRDAPAIATGVFGDAKDHPDVVGVPNARLDEIYRQAFVRNDRAFLQAEARRDPEQFLKVADRIGVHIPPPAPPPMPMPPPTPPPPPPAPPPAPAMAPPMPAAPPSAPPGVIVPPFTIPTPAAQGGPPIILGPNGQPLPPSGVM